jgi:hypothetical protein
MVQEYTSVQCIQYLSNFQTSTSRVRVQLKKKSTKFLFLIIVSKLVVFEIFLQEKESKRNNQLKLCGTNQDFVFQVLSVAVSLTPLLLRMQGF